MKRKYVMLAQLVVLLVLASGMQAIGVEFTGQNLINALALTHFFSAMIDRIRDAS